MEPDRSMDDREPKGACPLEDVSLLADALSMEAAFPLPDALPDVAPPTVDSVRPVGLPTEHWVGSLMASD